MSPVLEILLLHPRKVDRIVELSAFHSANVSPRVLQVVLVGSLHDPGSVGVVAMPAVVREEPSGFGLLALLADLSANRSIDRNSMIEAKKPNAGVLHEAGSS